MTHFKTVSTLVKTAEESSVNVAVYPLVDLVSLLVITVVPPLPIKSQSETVHVGLVIVK